MLELRNAGRLAGVGAFGVSARSSSGSPCPWLMLGREHLNLDLANCFEAIVVASRAEIPH